MMKHTSIWQHLFKTPHKLAWVDVAGVATRYLEAGPATPSYVDLRLGPEELTANYRDPRPFTERHPELLWLSLGIAIVLIGVTALKTLRSPAEKPPNPS